MCDMSNRIYDMHRLKPCLRYDDCMAKRRRMYELDWNVPCDSKPLLFLRPRATMPLMGIRDRVSKRKKEFAKSMRRRPTPAERKLWEYLRCGCRRGWPFRFRRQSVILEYIADFYCPAAHVVIEVDGGYHDPVKDAPRDGRLARRGFLTLRFANGEVLSSPLAVRRKILQECLRRHKVVPH